MLSTRVLIEILSVGGRFLKRKGIFVVVRGLKKKVGRECMIYKDFMTNIT